MVNNTHDRKLDELVKQALTDYEVPSADSDWSQMETILDAAPKSTSTNFTLFESSSFTKVVLPYTIIAIVMLVGGYFIYTMVNSSKTEDTQIAETIIADSVEKPTSTVIAPAKEVSKEIAKADSQKVTTVDTAAKVPVAAEKIPAKITEPVVAAKPVEKEKSAEKVTAPVVKKVEKTDEEKAAKKELDKQAAIKKEKEKKEKDRKERERKEKERKEKLKKDSIAKSTQKKSENVGLNNLFLRGINADSVRKYQNQPKDTLKAP
ncbi:MAG: hypothetical protein V4608_14355 [Bacteroidota bacterium]